MIIYASPNATKHKALWSNIWLLAPPICSPWILFGDFNANLCRSDLMGASSMKLSNRVSLKQDLIYFFVTHIGMNLFLIQLSNILSILNRITGLSYFRSVFQLHALRMLHSAIFSGWSSHFNRMVADNWSPSSSLRETIISFTKAADVWNKTIYGYIGSKKRLVMARLCGVQNALCTKSSRFLVNLESKLIMEIENILDNEELL
ncbi:hypothetical protein V6N13_103390 [Hibiscus sabdariffa]